VKLDRAGHDLLTRHKAYDLLERDTVNIDLAVRDRAGRQDARELLRDVADCVSSRRGGAKDQVVCSNQAAQAIQPGLGVDRELRGLRDIHAGEHGLGCYVVVFVHH
jgi:hypothetical protein